MFGIDSGELLIIAVVALVVIGPKDLPGVMRSVGQWIGRARGMARHFRSGLDTMMREAELEEMEKGWKANNDEIMRAHPSPAPDADWAEPVAALEDDLAMTPPPSPGPARAARPKAAPGPKVPPRKRNARPIPPIPALPPTDETP
jgi:sec-independent protein translocase protein TatB